MFTPFDNYSLQFIIKIKINKQYIKNNLQIKNREHNSRFLFLILNLFADNERGFVQFVVEMLFHCATLDNIHVVELVVLNADYSVAYALF